LVLRQPLIVMHGLLSACAGMGKPAAQTAIDGAEQVVPFAAL